MITPFRAVVAVAVVAIGFIGADALHAQSYPARSVTLIVPYCAGTLKV